MFVRILVLLISHVLCCFSVLVCRRSLVQFVAQRREIKQSWNLGPCQCDRAHLVCLSPRGAISACLVSRISRVALVGPSLHRFNTCAVRLLRQLRAIECTAHDRKHMRAWDWKHCIQSNAYGTAINHTTYDRVHPWPGTTLIFVYK